MARDTDAPAPRHAEARWSQTAELLFAANLAASQPGDRPYADADWARRQRDQLPEAARAFLPRLEGLWWPTMGLVDLFCWNRQFDDPEAFLTDLGQMPIDRFLAILFNQDFTVEQIRAFVAAPPSIRGHLEDLCQFSSGSATTLEALLRDPEGHRRGLIDLIRGSDTALFRETLASWTPGADDTIRSLTRRLAAEEPYAVMESLRGKPTPGPRQYERFTFIVSHLIGHRHIRSHAGDQFVFFFQNSSVDLHGRTEAGAELADDLKVLGDRTRLEILRMVLCSPTYGKEIASNLGLTTATVSRHLDQLKAAGLVKEDRADSNNVKRIRGIPEALETRWARLKAYLLP